METNKKPETEKSKSKSYRADPKTHEKLEEIAANFPNSGAALKHLIELYEFKKAQNAFPGSSDILNEIQNLTESIKKAFLYALELKESAENHAKEAVHNYIDSKDATIADLQERDRLNHEDIARLKADYQAQLDTETLLLDRTESAEKALQKAESTIVDKDKIISAQDKQIAELMHATENAKALSAENNALCAEAEKHKKEQEKFRQENAALHDQFEKAKTDYERNIQFAAKETQAELRAAVLETKEKAQQKINTYIAKIEAKDNEIARLNAGIVAQKLRTSKKEKSAS